MIEIQIPKENFREFIGTCVLDTLHDAKEIYVNDILLKELTNIVSYQFKCANTKNTTSNDKEYEKFKIYIFKTVFDYFYNVIWKEQPERLVRTTTKIPDFENNEYEYWVRWMYRVYIPLRTTFDHQGKRMNTYLLDVNKITPVNSNWKYIYNHYFNKDKYHCFQSPDLSIQNPEQYHTKLNSYYQSIQNKLDTVNTTKGYNHVNLDMKGSAGLIRVLTEPYGYVNNITLYMDCGYQMIGMSKIRFNSNHHTENLKFKIIVETDFNDEKFVFLDVSYETMDDIRNVIIHNTNALQYENKLPSAKNMSYTFSLYVSNRLENPPPKQIKVVELFEKFHEHCKKDLDFTTISDYQNVDELFLNIYNQIDNSSIKKYEIKKIYIYLNKLKNEYSYFDKLLSEFKVGDKNFYKFLIKQVNTNDKKSIQYFKQNDYTHLLLDIMKFKQEIVSEPFFHYYKKQWKVYFRKYTFPDEFKMNLCNITGFSPDTLKNIDYVCLYINLFLKNTVFKNRLDISQFNTSISMDEIIDIHPLPVYNTRHSYLSKSSPHHLLFKSCHKQILGKLLGDFGQIVWCMKYNKIFATEDTNTACMAKILQHISYKQYKNNKFLIIYGKGDGGSVYIN